MKMLDINQFVSLCIQYAKTNGLELTHLKLQKALYYIQAWNVAYFGDQLFEDLPEAWVNGPVYTSVYATYRDYKGGAIVEPKDCILEEAQAELRDTLVGIDRMDEQKELMAAILDKYMPRSAGELVYQTHREKPWIDARIGCGPFDASRNPITKEAMQTCYGGLIRKEVATA